MPRFDLRFGLSAPISGIGGGGLGEGPAQGLHKRCAVFKNANRLEFANRPDPRAPHGLRRRGQDRRETLTDPDAPIIRHDLTLVLRRRDLARRQSHAFTLEPGPALRAELGAMLGLEKLRKFRFAGRLNPLGRADWELVADLGATVVQACVVTLDPVTTRIDETVERRFLRDLPEPEGEEVETPEDEDAEPLGAAIDIGAIATEALMLALPHFPRADGAGLGAAGALETAPPGERPLNETTRRPFAELAALRAKLGGGDGTG